MTDLWKYLKSSGGHIVLYGTGNGADKIIAALESRGIGISAVFASDGFVRDRCFHGFKVLTFEECAARYPDMKVLMCFGSSRPEVLENVERISSKYEFYAPDVPVFGTGLFDAEFYEKHRYQIDTVREHLSDAASVKCFDDHIKFKLSGNIRYLSDCETSRTDTEREFFTGDTFIDLGAYNGDTVMRFAELNPGYANIIAVEPDTKNFEKLRKNTCDLRGVTYINAAVYDRDGEILFDTARGRGSGKSDIGHKVSCISVDSLTAQFTQPPKKLYIKMDVEGCELDAMNGAQNTIRRYKPSMSIACYHRNEDIFTIPLRALQLVPEYRIFMRHSPQIPAWDSEFYFEATPHNSQLKL